MKTIDVNAVVLGVEPVTPPTSPRLKHWKELLAQVHTTDNDSPNPYIGMTVRQLVASLKV